MGADQSTAIHDITGTSFPLSKCRIVVVGPTRFLSKFVRVFRYVLSIFHIIYLSEFSAAM